MVYIADTVQTVGEKYRPAMEVQTAEEAAEYFEACVQHHIRTMGDSREKAEQIQRFNIGYIAGYYDAEKRKRVWDLYGFNHPILGRP